MAEHGEEEAATLEFTPTWIVALVCSIIVLISLLAERCLHYLGKVTRHPSGARSPAFITFRRSAAIPSPPSISSHRLVFVH